MEMRCCVITLFMMLPLFWMSASHELPPGYGQYMPYFREEVDRARHLNRHLLDELKDLRLLHANLQFHIDALDLRYGSSSRSRSSLREDPLPSLDDEIGVSSFSVNPPQFSSQRQPGFTLTT